jgi:hypothetical protein
VSAVLVGGPLHVGSVTFDINTLAYACLAVLVGAQIFLFGALALIYGLTEGITRHQHAVFWTRVLRLEACLVLGLGLVLLGVFGSLWAVSSWGAAGFGPLQGDATIRLVLPSATAIALGVTVVFAGFFASLLGLRRAEWTPGGTARRGVERPPADRDETVASGARSRG